LQVMAIDYACVEARAVARHSTSSPASVKARVLGARVVGSEMRINNARLGRLTHPKRSRCTWPCPDRRGFSLFGCAMTMPPKNCCCEP
jgi:hypothetical protein